MALVKPDFSEVQEEVSPGVYKVRVRKGEIKEWSNGGGHYINWEMETFGESEPKNNGRRIFYKTSTSGKAAFMLQKFYRAATGQPLTGAFDTEQLVGKNLEVEVIDGVNRTTGEKTGYTEIKRVSSLSNS